jgi:LPPG:FO 2-phospho-L-lactate transferase
MVLTDEGELPFQEYFVHRRCEPAVRGFRFHQMDHATAAPGVLAAIQQSDLIIICPSNPWVSIDPILSTPGLQEKITSRPVIAVSPIIGGQAVKGPAAKMYTELGIEPSALAVAQHYRTILDGFVFDQKDSLLAPEIQQLGIQTFCGDTWMKTSSQRKRLAQDVLKFGKLILEKT